jgi:membrane-associated phospholipid phosphatase
MTASAQRRVGAAPPGDAGSRADFVAGLGLLGVGAVLTVLVTQPCSQATLQRVDDSCYRLVQRNRSAPLTLASRVLDIALGTEVDWTVRVAVTAMLVRQRRWRALAAWATTIALGEVCVGPLKGQINRLRPPEPLTTTSMTSYPSGHAIAAATTAPGIVLALLPPGVNRRRWLGGAVGVAAATALSRSYLNAHWLSDCVGGFCLGTGFSLVVPRLVGVQRPR